MKKAIWIFLALTVCLCLVSACGKTAEPAPASSGTPADAEPAEETPAEEPQEGVPAEETPVEEPPAEEPVEEPTPAEEPAPDEPEVPAEEAPASATGFEGVRCPRTASSIPRRSSARSSRTATPPEATRSTPHSST